MTAENKFNWTIKHSKMTLIALIGFLLIGGGYAAVSLVQTNKETALQADLIKIEKAYNEKKQNFEDAESPAPAQAKDDKTPPPAPKAKATGDMTQDYGTVIADFEAFVMKNKGSKAAQMAALHLSEIYRKYQKHDFAEKALSAVQTKPKHIISGLVNFELGKTMAEQQKCEQANTVWESIVAENNLKFMHATVLLQQGLCLESLGQKDQAEAKYKAAKDLDPQGSGRVADQWIRLIRAQASL
jgi:predicted negative regulator of RcsB-dependent stress response